MNEDEVLQIIDTINNYAEQIATLMSSLHEARAWTLLGFETWTALLESDHFTVTRQTLYKYARTMPVKQLVMEETGIALKTDQADALRGYDKVWLAAAVAAAYRRHDGKLTRRRLTDACDQMEEVYLTGHVSDFDGMQSAWDVAYEAKDKQRALDREAHINGDREVIDVVVRVYVGDTERTARGMIHHQRPELLRHLHAALWTLHEQVAE